LILVIVGTGLEWLYWTFAAAPLRAVVSTTVTSPRQAMGLALRRLAYLGGGVVLFASTMGAVLILPWPPNVDALVITATALVVAVRSAWMIADVVVSPHHPSLRLAAIQRDRYTIVVSGVAWLTVLAATTLILPQLLTTVGSAPHLARAVRVGMGGLVTVSLLAAVLIASRREDRSGKERRKRPRFPKAVIAGFVIVATAVLALIGGGRIAALLVNIAIVAASLGASKRIVFFFWRDNTAGDEEPAAEALPDMLPLLRTTLAIVFVTLFTLSALWTLGIQIAPLLAGAGIFGLAIGFGAQTLVRDVISGVFFLIEDVFRIGEYIESGTSTKGTVEHISFRTVALRHHYGPLTFVPYGLLGTVRNDSRDWVIDKFNIPLPLSVDSEKIRKMIKGIGEDLALDPELGPLIREPLKGKLYRVDPGVKIFRCKFMTAPGCQFDVRTAALKKIEAALVEASISFAGAGPQTILVRRAPDP
jgi:small-conductance mechanosensitive channel